MNIDYVGIVREGIADARTLDQLVEALNAWSGSEKISDYVDMSALPTFGGDGPVDTRDIWSWDEDRVMVQDGEIFVAVPRDEWFCRSYACGTDRSIHVGRSGGGDGYSAGTYHVTLRLRSGLTSDGGFSSAESALARGYELLRRFVDGSW